MRTSYYKQFLLLVLVFCLAVLLCLPWGARVRAEQAQSSQSSALAVSSALSLSYQWHTFYGMPADSNVLNAIGVDRSGNTYVAGYADQTWGSPLHAYSGDNDIVVIKLNSQGVYQWHTFYGAAPTVASDGDDEANGLAVDADGSVYLTGYADISWKGSGNQSPIHDHNGIGENMFVLKLNSSGSYQWHTFYQTGRANAIALDSTKSIYFTGYSDEEWGSPIHSTSGTGRLVVHKLNSSGIYQWHTYYGAGASAGDEVGYGIALDSANNVIVTGTTENTWLGGSGSTPPLHGFSGGAGYSTDIAVLKLNSSGAYQWHTFYGANENDDHPTSVSTSDNNIYIAGYSFSTWGSPIHNHAGEHDIAVLKLNASGQIQWNTFYGSSADDEASAICTDTNGNIYVAGFSALSWLGSSGEAPKHPYSGSGDSAIMVMKLNSNGVYQRHTFYGASDLHDYARGIALDNKHGIYLTGISSASWLGDWNTDPIHAYSGNNSLNGEGFILKLSDWYTYIPYVKR